jgi:pimeloyl-ACP methyl ester carboxylesterase
MRLHTELRGEGPPVLLLHAGGPDGRMWAPLAERLEGRFTLVIPDLAGFGRTPVAPEPDAPAEDVMALLEELGIERAAIVGNSFGGQVALELATAAPGRVSALALLASALPDHERSPQLEAFGAEEDRLWEAGDVDGVVALNLRTWLTDPAHSELVADMLRTACELQLGVEAPLRELPIDLGAIAVPTLAVSGGRDFADFAQIADRIVAEVRGAQRAEVPDAGHFIALERPDATAALLVPFLERVGA